MELVFMLLVFVAVLAVAAVAFCLWLVGAVCRGAASVFAPPRTRRPANGQACANALCRCDNPTDARFCRRCGRSLPALLRTVASRAAML